MPSEIDAIFASKRKPNAVPESPPPSSTTIEKVNKKKRKKKQNQKQADGMPEPEQGLSIGTTTTTTTTMTKRPAPETIVDTSSSTSRQSKKRQKLAHGPTSKETTKNSPNKSKDDDERFKDSRGERERSRTEEGWLVYTEEELGITGEGGDTPLCPFDCQCCF